MFIYSYIISIQKGVFYTTSLNERVIKIKNDSVGINELLEEYKPFIASCAQKITNKYLVYGQDDELSISLLAFAEAIKSYEIDRGNFLSFAKNIIHRRLIDYYRKQKRYNNLVSINNRLGDDAEIDLTYQASIKLHSDTILNQNRRDEIFQLKEELKLWGISFTEIANASPKHNTTKEICRSAVNFIISNSELLNIVREKKYLPIKELEKFLKLPRKTIEHSRKYIIALVLIKTGGYKYISDYIDWGK